MTGTADVGAVVVGGGIAGLAGALALQEATSEVWLVDASDRPGGVMRTDHVGGYVVERGPNTFQVKAPMLSVLRERRLESALVRAQPESRRRQLVRDGALVPLPMSPLALAKTPLLTTRGKLRLLAEPLCLRRDAAGESVAEFIGRRLGREVVTSLLGPFLTGVYAGDEHELGAEAVFGPWVALERRFGSLALGGVASLLRRGERGLRGTWSAPEGLGPFARRLAERLREPPSLAASVVGLSREQSSWRVSLSGPGGDSEVRAARLLLALPAYAAAPLLEDVDARVAELLAGIEYAPIAALSLGVARAAVREPIEGFGFLVPREEKLDLLGCLFMSRLFPGRAPDGHELLQCMLGGVRSRQTLDEPDDALLAHACANLDALLGLGGEPHGLGIARWPRAVPQPGRDHVGRIAELRARTGALPGLALAGSYVAGVGVADSFASGVAAARDLTRPL